MGLIYLEFTEGRTSDAHFGSWAPGTQVLLVSTLPQGAADFSFDDNFAGIWTPAKVPPDAATNKPGENIFFFRGVIGDGAAAFFFSLQQRG